MRQLRGEPLVLFRVSTWFALFFIPMIPISFKHYTACPNCRRIEDVSKDQVESARAQAEAMRAAGQGGAVRAGCRRGSGSRSHAGVRREPMGGGGSAP